MQRGQIISCMKTCKMIDKRSNNQVVRIKDLECEAPFFFELCPIGREFPNGIGIKLSCSHRFSSMTLQDFLLNGKLTLAMSYYLILIPFQSSYTGQLRMNSNSWISNSKIYQTRVSFNLVFLHGVLSSCLLRRRMDLLECAFIIAD